MSQVESEHGTDIPCHIGRKSIPFHRYPIPSFLIVVAHRSRCTAKRERQNALHFREQKLIMSGTGPTLGSRGAEIHPSSPVALRGYLFLHRMDLVGLEAGRGQEEGSCRLRIRRVCGACWRFDSPRRDGFLEEEMGAWVVGDRRSGLSSVAALIVHRRVLVGLLRRTCTLLIGSIQGLVVGGGGGWGDGLVRPEARLSGILEEHCRDEQWRYAQRRR